MNNNYKADKFKVVNASLLFCGSILNNKKLNFTVPGTFLSTLKATHGRYIDFDAEMEKILDQVKNNRLDESIVDFTYIDNIGFVDKDDYYPGM